MFSQDVIHRDIKLENILLDENYNLVLADFGLASIIKAENDSVSGAIGTENYMAP
jgi:serine/threonine protein kinase